MHGQKRAADQEVEVAQHASKHWKAGEQQMVDAWNEISRQEAMETIQQKLNCKNDISEIYSPPPIAKMAASKGTRAGFSLDLTTPDSSGYICEFSKADCRRRT